MQCRARVIRVFTRLMEEGAEHSTNSVPQPSVEVVQHNFGLVGSDPGVAKNVLGKLNLIQTKIPT